MVSMLQNVTGFYPGSTAIIRVVGDTLHSCRILLQDVERTCCFSSSERGSHLCDPEDQSDNCREEGWRVEDRPLGQCSLIIDDFTYTDVGIYSFIFPDNFDDNEEVTVSIAYETSNGGLIAWVVILLILLLLTILLCWRLYKKHYSRDKGMKSITDIRESHRHI